VGLRGKKDHGKDEEKKKKSDNQKKKQIDLQQNRGTAQGGFLPSERVRKKLTWTVFVGKVPWGGEA